MKKVLLALAMVLTFAVSASAAVQEVGPVTIDVPEGWTAQQQGPAVMLIAPGQDAVLTVVSGPAQGTSAKEIAENGAKAVNGKDLKAEGDAWSFSFSQSGAEGMMLVSVQKDQAVVCTMIGDNPELMKAAKSVKLK